MQPLFFRVRSPEWRAAGLPASTKAYELAKTGKLNLVRDLGGRTGVTAEEAQRYFANVEPIVHGRPGRRRRAVT